MRLFNTIAELRDFLSNYRHQSIGLVPTMGALHAGHLSLIERSRQWDDIVVVSIFVNPLQFGPSEDLDRYPRPKQADQALCKSAGVDAIFMPSPTALYGVSTPELSRVTQVVPPASMTQALCGLSRPMHFQGVATVVTKLLNIVQPTRAYFGQKDAQQVAILKRLKQDLNLTGKIQVCPIVRAPDGLALSSRNRYLSAAERQQASAIHRSLKAAQAAFVKGERARSVLIEITQNVLKGESMIDIDYLALVHPDTLEPLQAVDTRGMMAVAAYVGSKESPNEQKTRLIDNLVLTDRAPIIAIDGPAGAGKSTVARQIAHRLGLLYLDTGAMYRALTWFVLHKEVAPNDETAVAQLLPQCQIQLVANVQNDQPQPPKVFVNGEDVTRAIRTATVTANVSTVAAQSAVRTRLVEQQQQYGLKGGLIADGRDIGTQVFPNAELKIYLTASVTERAHRRYRDLQRAQQPLPSLDELAQAIAERDRKDSTREVSPLRKAADAIEIVTDNLSADEVIDKISALYRQLTA
ncbi:MAG: bifunctional pantoate--beta-alanine ligase/(d)CMP kinase [Cyanobacteria bacterium J06626_6]